MDHSPFTLMTDFSQDLENCLNVLRKGGVIVYPTDTVWGLGCDATDAGAVDRIFRIKQRPENKSMIVLLADEREVLTYVTEPDLQVFDYLKTVTRPTTVIYKGVTGLAENLVGADGTAGIRIVQEPFCRHLVKRFRKPVVSTSANVSGGPTPGTFREIAPTVLEQADYVVQYRRDDLTPASPSGIIRWNRDGSITTIR